MATKKMCPHCGGTMFMGAITRACIVEVFAPDKEGEEESFNVSKETKDKYSIEVVKCIRCKRDVSKDELITGVVCKECGRPVAPDDLNKDGICSVCEAKKTRSELANASQDDLIRMLLEAEKRSSSVSEKISKKVEQAEAVNNSANDDTTGDAAVDTKAEELTKKAEESTEKETKKRAKAPRGRKKNTDETAEGNESKSETEDKPTDDNKSEKQSEDIKEAVDNLANSQEAPFPDFPGMNAPTESETQAAEDSSKELVQENNNLEDEESVNAQEPFQMFDENEEPF